MFTFLCSLYKDSTIIIFVKKLDTHFLDICQPKKVCYLLYPDQSGTYFYIHLLKLFLCLLNFSEFYPKLSCSPTVTVYSSIQRYSAGPGKPSDISSWEKGLLSPSLQENPSPTMEAFKSSPAILPHRLGGGSAGERIWIKSGELVPP